MRFHVLAVPHTVTNEQYSGCAFTQKVLKFCKMMHTRGHHVIHYGHDRSNVVCSEKVDVMNDAILEKCYGNYDWRAEGFKHESSDAAHMFFNLRAAEEVASRKQAGDYLLLFWGLGHAHIAKCHPDMIIVEPGIGSFNNVLAPYSVFESYAVMHHIYGKFNLMPRLYDAVIPNYFDTNDFIDASTSESKVQGLSEAFKNLKDPKPCLSVPYDYVLFIGRIIHSKGLQLAITACREAGLKLLVAGQGNLTKAVDADFTTNVTPLEDPTGVTHIGYIEPLERSILIARAECLICPTLYAEPFGGVNVESQMSGVPVVTTDFGGFAETVVHGISGYRCRSLEQFVWSLKNVKHLDRSKIRSWASNYNFLKVGSMYEEYFTMIKNHRMSLTAPERLGLKWLEKTYP
jgi:glycosyltransferase involved in cell wall biosynthesis